jgi:hypothetical protein
VARQPPPPAAPPALALGGIRGECCCCLFFFLLRESHAKTDAQRRGVGSRGVLSPPPPPRSPLSHAPITHARPQKTGFAAGPADVGLPRPPVVPSGMVPDADGFLPTTAALKNPTADI